MIIGGGEIYALGMKVADQLVISHVEMDVDAQGRSTVIKFPEIDPDLWEVVDTLPVTARERDEAIYSIKVYRRKATLTH